MWFEFCWKMLWNTRMLLLSIINLDLKSFYHRYWLYFFVLIDFSSKKPCNLHNMYIHFTYLTFEFTVCYLITLLYKCRNHRMNTNNRMYFIIQNKKYQQQTYCVNPHILQFKAELIWKWSTKWFWKGKLSFSLSLSLSHIINWNTVPTRSMLSF